MLLATICSPIMLEAFVAPLVALLLTGVPNSKDTARQAVIETLADYHPANLDELRLVTQIVGCGLRSIQAIEESAAPDLPLPAMLRVMNSAVSLSRAAEAARKRLKDLQANRQQAPTQLAPATRPAPATPQPATPAAEPDLERTKVSAIAKANGLTWTQAYNKRQQDMRIAASLKRAEARVTAIESAAAPHPQRSDFAAAVVGPAAGHLAPTASAAAG